MAKKTRKVLKQASSQRAIHQAMSNVQSVSTIEATTGAPAARTPLNPAARTPKVELDPREEYKYVRNDLKRIAVLAGSFTAILIVLSFFIK
jgi:hypothetical protein